MDKWIRLVIDSECFVIKFQKNIASDSNAIVTCWLSNFKLLWTESIASIAILQKRFSELNRQLDIDDDKLFEMITRLPQSIQYTEFQANENGKHKLSFEYHLSKEIKARYCWLLQKSNEQLFFEHITKPMMSQMLELHTSRSQLIDLVQRKDQEIEQYKMDGAKLTRKQLATKPFESDDVSLKVDMFECSVADFSRECGAIDGDSMLKTESKDNTGIEATPGRIGKKTKTIKGLVPLKRIQPIQYVDSDDDSQADKQTSYQNVTANKQTSHDTNHTKRIRKIPNL